MRYSEYLAQTPWFWVALAGLSLAAALRGLVIALLPRGRSRRAREQSIAAALFLMSTCLVMVTLAVFIPGPSRFVDSALWLFGLATVAVAFAALTMPLLVGVPLVLLLSAFLVLFSGYLQLWTVVHPPDDLASLRVVGAHDNRLSIELLEPDYGDRHQPLISRFDIEGTALSLEIELVELHEALFLLGRRYSFRLQAVHGYRFDASEAVFSLLDTREVDNVLPEPAAWIESLLHSRRVPGVRIQSLGSDARRVGVLSEYTLRMTTADRLTIEERD